MDEIMEKITDSELEVLKVLWASDSALPLSVIRSSLQAAMKWEAATIKTLLARLVAKSACSERSDAEANVKASIVVARFIARIIL